VQLTSREQILALTRAWEGERFPDGRPRVPDDLLERMRLVTTEEAWGVLRRNEYQFQFAGDWMNLHPDRVLVGRAVTAAFLPARPDARSWAPPRGASGARTLG
jgi:4-hydroxy-4-methyl-2-oxoglutarate aldolase